MSISLRVTEEELSVIKSYADLHGTSVSDAVRGAILEKIENEFDIEIYTKAINAHETEKRTYTHDEMLKELNLK